MAVMTSHQPDGDAVLLDQKSESLKMTASVGDEPNGVNGHVSPVEIHPETTSEPELNTKSALAPQSPKPKDEVPESNETVTQNNDAFAANQTVSVEQAEEPEKKDSALAEDLPKEAEKVAEPVTDQPKDTEMTDAPKPAEEAVPLVEKAEEAPVAAAPEPVQPSEIVEPTTEEAPKAAVEEEVITQPETSDDVKMTDAQPEVDVSPGAENLENTQTSTVEETSVAASADITSEPISVSQLNIDTQDDPTSITANTSMTDAPSQPSVKVAREREDDVADEPAAKRARTLDADDVVQDTVKVMTGPIPQPMDVDQPAGDLVPLTVNGEPRRLNDPALDNNPITGFMNREIRRVLGGIKKTKAGGQFKLSVQVMWPALWESYIERIKNPIDIGSIEHKLRQDDYKTLGAFKNDVRLISENSVTFNGNDHNVTASANLVVRQIFERLGDVPAEQPAKPEAKEAKNIPTRHAEPRAAAPPRRESRGAATSPTEKVSDSPVFAVPPSGVPIIRRDSTKNDGDRPKRPIHPPKSKDLGFQAKNLKKKKLQPDFKFCDDVLTEIKKQKYYMWNQYFLEPVDPVALNIPNYHKVIKQPMDLQTITEKLHSGEYESPKAFEGDFNLMLKNCFKFNPEGHLVHSAGIELEKLFKEKWAEKDAWMAKHAPAASAPAASGASPHGKDDSDDEADASDAEPEDEPVSTQALDTLTARLHEEQKKLDDALQASKLDPTFISLQQSMIQMIQNQIVTEKIKLQEQTNNKKPAAKPKASKSKKAAGGATSGASKKAAATATAAKKSGGSAKKPPKTRKLDVDEREIVSLGIGNLDGPALDQAIDIIRKDTNIPDNDEAELELDMEQLSEPVLLKLFDIVMKAFPQYKDELKKKREQRKAEEHPNRSALPKSSKPKKNKPMGKQEQERKLEQLRELKAQYARNGSGSQEPLPSVENGGHEASDHHHESDEDSSSEEE